MTTATTYYIKIPVKEEITRKLRVSHIVYLTGIAYSFPYPQHYKKLYNINKENDSIRDLINGVILHFPASFRKINDRYRLEFIGPTTSVKFTEYMPKIIDKFNVKFIVGKGGLNRDLHKLMIKNGTIYLSAIGGGTPLYSSKMDIIEILWPEPDWTYAALKLQLQDAGPFIVSMDLYGNSLHKT